MTLFKKKKDEPSVLALLYDKYKRSRENQETTFYYPLFDHEKKFAEQFCKKNHLRMTLDHVADKNLIYKFTIIGD